MSTKALVLYGDGINCEEETMFALAQVGFSASLVHITDLLNNNKTLNTSQLFVIPGGFSFADEIRSGKVLALKLKDKLLTQLINFIEQGKFVLGICNGFQVLASLGLLPDYKDFGPHAIALAHNKTGKFSNHWVKMTVDENTKSPFFKNLKSMTLPTRHGEGQLIVAPQIAPSIKELASLRYENNFNGSFDSIAALTNKAGNVLGIMPHPEAFVRWSQHPAWTSLHKNSPSTQDRAPDGLVFFRNAFEALQ